MRSILTNDLGRIIYLNNLRLKDTFYSPEEIFLDKNEGWPGDWQGRIMLALYSHYTIKKDFPLYLNKYLNEFESEINGDGYFGPTINFSNINEQQLAGNSWFLRFLCMYYNEEPTEKVYSLIKRIVVNLFLPIKDHLDFYNNIGRIKEGQMSGYIKESKDTWEYSTDVGCLFISIDGLAHAYSILKDDSLNELINILLDKFFETDVVKNKYQTHATLTALRGALEFYNNNHDKELLKKILKRFSKYESYGMTLNYANFNWFKRNDTWTEGCCVVDSFILAKKLYIETNQPKYLELAYKIMYNALFFSIRSNGGCGCDSCTSIDNTFLYTTKDSYDAYWCCTMRCAEFCKDVSECLISDELITPLPGKHFYGQNILEVEDGFPYTDGLLINLDFKEEKQITIHLPISDFDVLFDGAYIKKDNKIIISANKNTKKIIINFHLEPKITKYKNISLLDYGVLRLTNYQEKYAYKIFDINGKKYMPIPKAFNYSKEDTLEMKLNLNVEDNNEE